MEWLSNYLFTMINICICGFETFTFWDVGKSFLHPRFKTWWKNWSILLGLVVLNQMVNTWGNPSVVLVSFFLLYCVCAIILFTDYFIWKSIYVIFFGVVQSVSELVFYLIAFGIGVKDISREFVWQYAIFGMISKLIAFFILLLAAKKFSKGQIGQLPWKIFCTYLVMPVSSMFILFSVMSFQNNGDATHSVYVGLVLSSVAVLIANAILLHIFEGYAASMEMKKRFALREQKAELEIKYYQQLESINQKNSCYLHNIKYILQSAESLLASGETLQAREVLNRANQEIICTNPVRYCSHSILNAILCSKRELAESIGIDYQVEAEVMMDTGKLEAEELIIVLGNMLDNAIEAAAKLSDKGFVKTRLRMKNRGTFLSISVENNYNEEPERRGNRLVSQKRGKEEYGYGLESVSKIVERCNGIENISYKDKIFIHQVALSTRY